MENLKNFWVSGVIGTGSKYLSVFYTHESDISFVFIFYFQKWLLGGGKGVHPLENVNKTRKRGNFWLLQIRLFPLKLLKSFRVTIDKQVTKISIRKCRNGWSCPRIIPLDILDIGWDEGS